MSNPHPNENARCPYCGSKDFSVCTFGYADWECDVCHNTFKSPYIPSERTSFGSSRPPKEETIMDKIEDFIFVKLPFICIGLVVLLMVLMVVAYIIGQIRLML